MTATRTLLLFFAFALSALQATSEFPVVSGTERETGSVLTELDFEDSSDFEDITLMSTAASDYPAVTSSISPSVSDIDNAASHMEPVTADSAQEQQQQQQQQVDWQGLFAAGFRSSELLVAQVSAHAGSWEADAANGAGVPSQMLAAESSMLDALQKAPEGKEKKEKVAVYALRLYTHAKWLAEKNHALAAEARYWKAKEFALMCRRSVLAGHALSRLGYFLMSWGRHAEARSVLEESVRISNKSNPLAPYLLGVLDRKAAAGDADAERLRLADDRILSAERQPSEDLEEKRQKLVGEIKFWQQAEASPRNCLETSDVAHVAICLVTHLAVVLQRVVA